ncbi:MAG: hypothetical protein ACK4QL_02120 [Pseudanabaenaceae cyanobacterium]
MGVSAQDLYGAIARSRTTGDKGYGPVAIGNVQESRQQGTGVAQCLWQSR